MTPTPPPVEPSACSARSELAAEPLAGTAPFALGWIAVEQPGPFGPNALLDSHFPTSVGHKLLTKVEPMAIRPQLIRTVGSHADQHTKTQRTVLLARSRANGSSELFEMCVQDTREVLNIDFDALLTDGAANDIHPAARSASRPALLVCTHAKRDVCCALRGRPVAKQLADDGSVALQIWEASHLGGHRFAPTAAFLPDGWLLGRLEHEPAAAAHALQAGQLPLDSARGASCRTPRAQVADIAYRQLNNLDRLADLVHVTETEPDVFSVMSAGHAPRTVRVRATNSGNPQPKSCGDPVTQVTAFTHEWV